MVQRNYQYDYSKSHNELYNSYEREQKASKIISIIEDFYLFKNISIKDLNLLDIGCSTGIMTNLLSKYFRETIGIDIDEEAMSYAKKNFESRNLHFLFQDSMNIQFAENSFDVINCTHIYEHVPDSSTLLDEIHRVLKPGGICFFSAANRYIIIEPHYRLPFLSWLPRYLANKYLKLFRNIDYYYESLLPYGKLKKLVRDFEITDYTTRVIRDPVKYHATEMIKPDSLAQKIYLFLLNYMLWISPTYLWILQKK